MNNNHLASFPAPKAEGGGTVQIEESWKIVLQDEFVKPYFKQIVNFLKQEKATGKIIYPAGSNIFNAFALTPFNQVKVVILGQDPYHQPNQAHGLSFSVLPPTPPPPSLQNIYKELINDIPDFKMPTHGNLAEWAQQGVLLLNASLTVQASQPMSHSKIGWEQFTDAVIANISQQKEHIVFILWGKFAQSKRSLIDENRHYIITSAHPSPLSAHNGFFGSKPFSLTNKYLLSKGLPIINWNLT